MQSRCAASRSSVVDARAAVYSAAVYSAPVYSGLPGGGATRNENHARAKGMGTVAAHINDVQKT